MSGLDGAAPRRQRSHGHVRLALAQAGGATRVAGLSEAGPSRLRRPTGERFEGVLLNTAGGLACGDRFHVEVHAGPGTDAVLTTTAAEKVYRSDGPVTELAVDLHAGAGARLAWLPQETILYESARLARRLTADMASDATLTLFEATVFGRAASGERLTRGSLVDAWRVTRGGRLAYADTLRLEGDLAGLLARPALGGGAGAIATLLHLAPDAEARLEEARAYLAAHLAAYSADLPCEAAASAWNGHLAVRLMSPAVAPLRAGAARFLAAFLGRPMPRVWQT